jgi:hypothetical protein
MAIVYAIIITTIFVLACVLILYVGNMLRFKLLTKKAQEHPHNYKERLLNPDFKYAEHYYGHSLSKALYQLYQNQDELLKEDFYAASKIESSEYMYYIASYEPCDKKAIDVTWPGIEQYFSFAGDGCGNCYLIDPVQENSPVLFYDHETAEKTEICNSLEEFLKWPRKYM